MTEEKEGAPDQEKDGAHTHRLPIHYCYDLGPYEEALFIIYHYQARGEFTLNFKSKSIPEAVEKDPAIAVFKIPAKNRAVFELDEVWTGHENPPGQYKVTFTLLPAPVPEVAEEGEEKKKSGKLDLLSDSIPPGSCTISTGPCAGTYSPCAPGQIIKQVSGSCGCHNKEGG